MASKSTNVAQIHAAIACLGRLTAAFAHRRQQLATSVGLSEGQWGVLEEIATQHFMPSMFARHRASSAAAVSKTLRQLIDKGLISVALSKTDGRQRDYVLTGRGQRALDVLRKERELAVEEIWTSLPAAEIGSFIAFGSKLSHRMERYGSSSKET